MAGILCESATFRKHRIPLDSAKSPLKTLLATSYTPRLKYPIRENSRLICQPHYASTTPMRPPSQPLCDSIATPHSHSIATPEAQSLCHRDPLRLAP